MTFATGVLHRLSGFEGFGTTLATGGLNQLVEVGGVGRTFATGGLHQLGEVEVIVGHLQQVGYTS